MGLIGLIAELLVLGSCAAAVVTNAMLLASCDFMGIENFVGRDQGSFGLYKFRAPGDEKCSDIPEDAGDGWFTTAQVCAVIAFCAGGILLVLAFFKQCIVPLPCTQRLMDLSATLVQVCLALVYLVWGSEICDTYHCFYGDQGTLLILTQVFWLAAGCFSRCMRPGRFERRDEIAAQKEAKAEAKKRQEAEDELKKKEEDIAQREAAMEEQAGAPAQPY